VLEVIATCVNDVQKIIEGGGQRIELVSALSEGGITPSGALVKHAVRAAGAVPVMVMIRPHAQSFVYSREDMKVMKEDIETALSHGAAGIVLGALTSKRELDRDALDRIFSADLKRRSVTFHRALDQAANLATALTQLLDYPVDRILTSGGPGNIMDNLKMLKHLAALGGGKIKIMAGGGVRLNNVQAIMETAGIEEIHVGTPVRKSGGCMEPIDPLIVRQFRDIMR
jgi:copper homeostasis protein